MKRADVNASAIERRILPRYGRAKRSSDR